MTRYHAHPNGYLTIDDDPPITILIAEYELGSLQSAILSELASDGNKAREWAERAAELAGAIGFAVEAARDLINEMAEYHRGKAS